MGGFRAWFLAKWASGDRFVESAGQPPEELRDIPISARVFNPASALSNCFKVDAHGDRPESIMAHIIVSDLPCTGWASASSEVSRYFRKPGYTLHSIENFCFSTCDTLCEDGSFYTWSCPLFVVVQLAGDGPPNYAPSSHRFRRTQVDLTNPLVRTKREAHLCCTRKFKRVRK